MGQYFDVCLKADDGTKKFFDPMRNDAGLKLMEHSWWKNGFVNAIAKELCHAPHAVVWVGDYSHDGFPVKETDKDGKETVAWKTKYGRLSIEESQVIFDALHRDGETPTPYEETADPRGWTLKGKMLVNYDRKEFLDCDGYFDLSVQSDGYCAHPLPILTAAGNGLGGGDYFGACVEYAGRWCGDRISVEDEAPDGFYELPCFFSEDPERSDETAGPYAYVKGAMRRFRKNFRGSVSLPVTPEDVPVKDDGDNAGLPVSVTFTNADGETDETEFLIEPEFFAGIHELGDFWAELTADIGELWDEFSRENGVEDSSIGIDAPVPEAANGDPHADIKDAVRKLRESLTDIPRFCCAGDASGIRFFLPVEVSFTGPHYRTAEFRIPHTRFFDGSEEMFWAALAYGLAKEWDRYRKENGLADARVYGVFVGYDKAALSGEEIAALLPDGVLSAAMSDALQKDAENAVWDEFISWKADGLVPYDVEMTEEDRRALAGELVKRQTRNAFSTLGTAGLIGRWLAGKKL